MVNPHKTRAYASIDINGSPIQLDSCRVIKKYNEWKVGEFLCKATVDPCIIGDVAEIYFVRDSTHELMGGEVVNVTKVSSGKESPEYNITVYGPGRYMKQRVCQVGSTLDLDSSIIVRYMANVPSLSTTIEFTEETIGVSGRGMMYVSDAIGEVTRDHDIYWESDLGNTVHFWKGVKDTSAVSFSLITSKERVDDITELANSVTLYSVKYVIEEEKDYYTESTVNWIFRMKDLALAWRDPGNNETLTTSTITPKEGSYSIKMVMGGTCFGDPVLCNQQAWLCIPLKQTIVLDEDINRILKFNISNHLFSVVNPLTPSRNPRNMKVYLLEESFNEPPNLETGTFSYTDYDIMSGQNPEQNDTIRWSTKMLKVYETLHFTNVNNADSITHLGIWMERPSYISSLDLYLDGIYFSKFIKVAIKDTTSIGDWGIREIIPKTYVYEEDTPTQLTARAVKILDVVKDPEVSVRELEIEGTAPIYTGYQYTFTFFDETKAFIVDQVEHIWDGTDWKSQLVLSTSPEKEPVGRRAKTIKSINKEVLALNRKVGELESNASVIEEYVIKEEVSPEGIPGIWGNWDGTVNIDYLRINVETGATFTIEKITNIEEMNVDNIGVIGTINTIHYMEVDTIGVIQEITDINRMNVDSIGTINTIENVGIMSVGTIDTIQEISDLGILVVDTIDSIGTINTIEFFYAKDASIDSIGYVGALTAINADFSTIGSVGKAFITDSSIGALSHVDHAYILDNTVITGTISTLTCYTAGIDLAYFGYCTISDVDISAGSIDSVIFNKCTITGVTIDSATISNLSVIGQIQGDNIITANNISNLNITWAKLESGIQNVLGSTLWEAENSPMVKWAGSSIVADSNASGGSIVQYYGNSITWIVFGPYLTLNPGDYWIHYRVSEYQSVPVVIDCVTYPGGETLGYATITPVDSAFHVYTILAKDIPGSTTIETRVRKAVIISSTIRIDYIKVEPAGELASSDILGPSFKIQTDHIDDLAITSSKIGSLEIKTSNIDDLSIINSKIGSFEITYDRLVELPLALKNAVYNHIMNPSFEFSTWGGDESWSDGGFFGKKLAWLLGWNSTTLGFSNYIDIRERDTITLGFWSSINWNNGDGTFWADLIEYDSIGGSPTGTICFTTISWTGSTIIPWTQYEATVAVNTNYVRVSGSLNPENPNMGNMFYLDGFQLVKSDQLPAFSDFTNYGNRWMPDMYYSKEINSLNVGSGTVLASVTISAEYKGLALIWAGVNAGHIMEASVFNAGRHYVNWYLELLHNGTTIASKKWVNDHPVSAGGNVGTLLEWNHISIVDEASIDIGTNTFSWEVYGITYGAPQATTVTAFVKERYVRALVGSRFV